MTSVSVSVTTTVDAVIPVHPEGVLRIVMLPVEGGSNMVTIGAAVRRVLILGQNSGV